MDINYNEPRLIETLLGFNRSNFLGHSCKNIVDDNDVSKNLSNISFKNEAALKSVYFVASSSLFDRDQKLELHYPGSLSGDENLIQEDRPGNIITTNEFYNYNIALALLAGILISFDTPDI